MKKQLIIIFLAITIFLLCFCCCIGLIFMGVDGLDKKYTSSSDANNSVESNNSRNDEEVEADNNTSNNQNNEINDNKENTDQNTEVETENEPEYELSNLSEFLESDSKYDDYYGKELYFEGIIVEKTNSIRINPTGKKGYDSVSCFTWLTSEDKYKAGQKVVFKGEYAEGATCIGGGICYIFDPCEIVE